MFVAVSIYLFCLSILERKIKLSKDVKLIFTIFPLFILIIFLRKLPDYKMYETSYLYSDNLELFIHKNLEKGYLLLTKIFYNLGISYHIFRIFFLSIEVFLFVKLFWEKENMCTYIFLFYINIFIITILIQYRSGLALVLFYNISIHFLLANKRIKFLMSIIGLTLIHKSIIMFLPSIVLKKIKKIKYYIILLFGILFFPKFQILLYIFLQNIIKIFPSLNKLNNYIHNKNVMDIGVRDCYMILMFVLILFYYKSKKVKDKQIYISLLFLGIFYRFFISWHAELGMRSYLFAQSAFVFLLPELMKNKKIHFIIGILMIINCYLLVKGYAKV